MDSAQALSWLVLTGGAAGIGYALFSRVLTDYQRARIWFLVSARCQADAEAALKRLTSTEEYRRQADVILAEHAPIVLKETKV